MWWCLTASSSSSFVVTSKFFRWNIICLTTILVVLSQVASVVPVKLSGNLVSNGDVTGFSLSSNGAWVVYRADELDDLYQELFSVSPDGSVASILISNNNVSYGANGGFESAQEFSISPNSQTVVYRAAQESDSNHHIYATPIDGSGNGEVTRLDADGTGGSVTVLAAPPPVSSCNPCAPAFLITPDSSTVLYRADRFTDLTFQIFSVPINGPRNASITLTPTNVVSMLLAVDGTLLVYRVAFVDLYTVPVDGSATEIIITPGNPGETIPANWKVSPEGNGAAGSRVAYVARNVTTSADSLRTIQLPFSAGSVQRLSQDPQTATNGPNIDIKSYLWSSDGLRVFFSSDPDSDGLFDLYVSPWDGSSGPVALTNMAASTSSTGVQKFLVSPDDSRVVYLADAVSAGVTELFSVSSFGPASSAVKISGNMDTDRDVISSWPLQFTPNSMRIIYGTDHLSLDDEINLWVALADGASGPIRLSPLITLFPGPLDDAKLANSNSRFAVYRGSLLAAARHEITAVGLYSGESSATNLNTPLAWSGGVQSVNDYAITMDDTRVVYLSDHETFTIYELFSVSIPASIVNDGGGGSGSGSGSGTTSSTSSASRSMPMFWPHLPCVNLPHLEWPRFPHTFGTSFLKMVWPRFPKMISRRLKKAAASQDVETPVHWPNLPCKPNFPVFKWP